ncbi:LIM domain-binding protein 2-like isoform X2 [Artemia franciscana]|uniref:LIM domain-binding protein 2-like isoform X2 n=1 Tax=Artemia franciscana TaxID=6661 RepID=UPI0032DA964C
MMEAAWNRQGSDQHSDLTGPGTPVFCGPSSGPPSHYTRSGPASTPTPGFTTPIGGSHFAPGPPSYSSSPVPQGPGTPGASMPLCNSTGSPFSSPTACPQPLYGGGSLPGLGLHHCGPGSFGPLFMGQTQGQIMDSGGPLQMRLGEPMSRPLGQLRDRPSIHGRRHFIGHPDLRIYELNKRLQLRTEESDSQWWDAFASEFFEDDATLTLTFCLEDGPKRYTIGRTLIPRYFRSIFDSGVADLYFHLRPAKESLYSTTLTLDCDQCTMITQHGKPTFAKVCTEGRLILEFAFDDLMRIKAWHFAIRMHREFVPRSVLSMHSQDPALLDQLTKNITRQGITSATLNYLRLCVILKPMQELMSRHKDYGLGPRDCLKTTLYQKWQRVVAPPESQKPPNKRRKRKGSNSAGAGTGANPIAPPSKKQSPGPNFALSSQDVMVVGEPSLMGGEFGEEDERLIARLENNQHNLNIGVLEEQGINHALYGDPSAPWQQDRKPPGSDPGIKSPTISQ